MKMNRVLIGMGLWGAATQGCDTMDYMLSRRDIKLLSDLFSYQDGRLWDRDIAQGRCECLHRIRQDWAGTGQEETLMRALLTVTVARYSNPDWWSEWDTQTYRRYVGIFTLAHACWPDTPT